MKVLCTLFLLVSIAITASTTGIQGRITNGFGASIAQFPYVVFIKIYLESEYFFCGGSLISSSWILTVAHCFDNPGDGNIIDIYLGLTFTDDVEIGYTLWTPDVLQAHPFWDKKSIQNDIALIEIPATPACTKIKAICLQPLNTPVSQNYEGQYGFASGWGLMSDGLGYPKRLQWGRIKIVPNEVCRRLKPSMGNKELCIDTSVDFVSSCIGDSGGPFVLESTGELVGVLSHSFGTSCEEGYPNILTLITPYLQWIKSITGISY